MTTLVTVTTKAHPARIEVFQEGSEYEEPDETFELAPHTTTHTHVGEDRIIVVLELPIPEEPTE